MQSLPGLFPLKSYIHSIAFPILPLHKNHGEEENDKIKFFYNTGALPGEVEMDSDDCAIAVAINNNNSYEAKAGIKEKSS